MPCIPCPHGKDCQDTCPICTTSVEEQERLIASIEKIIVESSTSTTRAMPGSAPTSC